MVVTEKPPALVDEATWAMARILADQENLTQENLRKLFQNGLNDNAVSCLCLDERDGACWKRLLAHLNRQVDATDVDPDYVPEPLQCWFVRFVSGPGPQPGADELTARCNDPPLLENDKRHNVAVALQFIWNAIQKGERHKRIAFLIYLMDRGHGLFHGLRSLRFSTGFGQPPLYGQDKDIVEATELLLSVFHDYASSQGRGQHLAHSGRFIRDRLGTMLHWESPAVRAAKLMEKAGQRHSVGTSDFDGMEQLDRALIQRHFDADRLDETLDLGRLVYVNRCANRSFFDPYLSLARRLDVCNQLQGRVARAKCGARGTDTLTILLYSLTRNLEESSYLTPEAKERVRSWKKGGVQNKLKKQLLEIIDREIRSSTQKAESTVKCVLEQFNERFAVPQQAAP